MPNQEIDHILTDWSDEFSEYLLTADALCVALFDADKNLLFATPVMKKLFKGEPYKSLINPTFDKLLSMKSDNALVFEGLLTIGDYNSINSSILANVFAKNDRLLIIGGADAAQLIEQYISMQHLNHQINNLQRQLIKEKATLENTLIQLNETNTALKQVIATKDKFFSIIAHDLKSPFNAILGFSNLLVEKIRMHDFKGIEKYAQIIIQSSNNAMELLMNLMEWSRSQTGRMEFHPSYFHIADFIDDTLRIFETIARQKSITISRNIPDKINVYADKAMLSTVFRNLIANALKFTMNKGNIIISATENENELIFSISDTGVGIPQSGMEKLFKIDENYSTPGVNREKGTGLGLILCKEFVEKHGGKIWVESQTDIGSTFYFSLPYPDKQAKAASNKTYASYTLSGKY